MDELVGAGEIAERFGWSRTSYVHDLRRRHADFPEPVATLTGAHVWVWPDIEKWAKANGKLPLDPVRKDEEGPGPEANRLKRLIRPQ